MFYFGKYDPKGEETKPLVNLFPVEQLCKDLSNAFHWNVNLTHDGEVNYIYKNGVMIYAFCDSTFVKDSNGVLRAIERTIRC